MNQLQAKVFRPKEIANKDELLREFRRWIKLGKEEKVLKDYKEERGLDPLNSAKYLHQIFANELKRHGQASNLDNLDIYQNFILECSRTQKLTFNIDGRVYQRNDELIILFPSFPDELAQKGLLFRWREEKEKIAKKNFYWQLWKLFFFEMRRQGFVENLTRRREIFDSLWPTEEHSLEQSLEIEDT